jgi:hypothetical protein
MEGVGIGLTEPTFTGFVTRCLPFPPFLVIFR